MNQKLIEFVVNKSHLSASEVKRELRIEEDLGFYELDFISFIEEFIDEFEIKVPQPIEDKLSIVEEERFFVNPYQRLKNFFIKIKSRHSESDLTIGHLEKVIERGEWFVERNREN